MVTHSYQIKQRKSKLNYWPIIRNPFRMTLEKRDEHGQRFERVIEVLGDSMVIWRDYID